jgi:uncharacterized membrane protein YkvA (DUF1232 family)
MATPNKPAAKGTAKKTTPAKTAKAAAAKTAAAKPEPAPPVASKAKKSAAAKPAMSKKITATKSPAKSVAKKKAGAAKANKSPTASPTKMTVQQAKKKAASATRSKYWDRAQRRARSLLRRNGELLDVAKEAEKIAAKMRSGPMSKLVDQLKALLRLVRAYATGEYKHVSWESMVLVVAAIAYVVSPLDLIPDFIPVVGYLDDAAVVGFVLKIVREELDEFIAWGKETGRGPKRRSSR